ncbi:MAG: hypothetical protein OXD49_17905 [Candidatus Poribacteria bacterium]|nr:hypothetical protein [Candidatus Poribacteria bacterium]
MNRQLFPPDGDYVTWIRDNNSDCPEFDASCVKLHLFHREKDDFPYRSLIPSKTDESLIREHLRSKDGFDNYSTVYLEVDFELLLRYTLKKVDIVRGPKGQGNPTIHFRTDLDSYPLIKDWIEAGMPEPWE